MTETNLPPMLVAPTRSELRLIAPSALALWRALVRFRADEGYSELEWVHADLRVLARRASICSYASARAALGKLRRAGLVATSRLTAMRWVRTIDGRVESVNAYGRNLYLVAGDYATRAGVHSYRFPRRAWTEFVAQRRSGTRPAVEAWWTSHDYPVDPRQPVDRGKPNPAQELDPEAYTSVYNGSNSLVEIVASEKAPVGAFLTSPTPEQDLVADLAALEDDDEVAARHAAASTPTIEIAGTAPPLVPRGPRSECPYLPPDPYPAPPPAVLYLDDPMVPEQRALCVLDGFRRAVREVYGQQWWHYSKGNLKASKGYAGLVACGDQMVEHAVPAEYWAIWRLRWFKASCPRFANRPPPVLVVMSAKAVAERAGWFRKSYQLPVNTLTRDPIIAEQHLRNHEAARWWRGLELKDALMFMPKWYVEKRRAEIAAGITCAHDCWPTKPGSRYGRVTRGA